MNRVVFFATQVYKPGSVLTAIYLVPGLLPGSSRLPGTVGQTLCSSTALLRIEFTAPQCSHGAGGLLHRLFTLARRNKLHSFRIPASGNAFVRRCSSSPHQTRLRWALTGPPYRGERYLSVALVLRSPSAGVTRYPCPVEPGLSSPGSFRNPAAAVQPGCGNIVTDCMGKVKHLANSFEKGYTIIENLWE